MFLKLNKLYLILLIIGAVNVCKAHESGLSEIILCDKDSEMELQWDIDPNDVNYMRKYLTEIESSHGTSILTTFRNKQAFQPTNFKIAENEQGIQMIWSFNIIEPEDFLFQVNNWRQYFRFGHRILYRYCAQIGSHSEVISEFNQAHQL